ncbi:hypothetical protein B5P44_00110 [Mycobacterium sp. CBMA 213]|uniref:Uncharacterized protein n=1 Tax=Mycolicibacterium sp. CBMA 213 TaxID=1968788 RepID=A0A343VQZ6_9MYCO|nr:MULTISPECIES: hypothetical protein [unclassified Mycolicibacterium]AVN58320.1 hypothetical protein B5P44_p00025 [Mycolicibacterium sp. CBMA 213]MUL60988.1 hypothetical protein [Mycolicibacterium sp. CBMA 335]MUM03225.1 hypothetical protein [Mycolicibacterium sp. CBMA 213]
MHLLIGPDCGYKYPPGSIATADPGVLDSVVEAAGRCTHPTHWPAPGSGPSTINGRVSAATEPVEVATG